MEKKVPKMMRKNIEMECCMHIVQTKTDQWGVTICLVALALKWAERATIFFYL
jgi:hypothetical protein